VKSLNPSPRIVTRFDGGDTMIRLSPQSNYHLGFPGQVLPRPKQFIASNSALEFGFDFEERPRNLVFYGVVCCHFSAFPNPRRRYLGVLADWQLPLHQYPALIGQPPSRGAPPSSRCRASLPTLYLNCMECTSDGGWPIRAGY